MARTAVCAVFAAVALALHASDAACPPGVAAPEVTTLMRSTANSEIDAWIVTPNCATSSGGTTTLSKANIELKRDDLQRIDSLPTGATVVTLNNAPLTRGADFSGAKSVYSVYIAQFDPRLIDNLKLPSTLDSLTLGESKSLKSVDKLILPNSLANLNLFAASLSSLKSLPSSLTNLELADNAFTEINFAIPSKLQVLVMDNNPIQKLERFTFPDSLTEFWCARCSSIKSIRGVKWSMKLTTLHLPDSPLEEFELRKSDYEVLSKQTEMSLGVSAATCSDDQAEPTEFKGMRFCVISDERFTEKYSGSSSTKAPSSGSGSGNGTASSSSTGDDATTSDGSDGTDTMRSSISDGSTTGGVNVQKNPSEENNSGGGIQEKTVFIFTSSPVIIILVAVSGVFGVLLAVLGYRHFRSSRQNRAKAGETPGSTLVQFDTPHYNHNQSSNGSSSQEYLSNDIRNDKALIPYRIDQKEITLSKQIARGGFGVIFRGTYNGRAVAVKQMLPDSWRNETQLIDFMDEVRLCASLSHPKIVEFIGLAWTSLRDISVVIEFMDGGDLHSLLDKHAHAQSPSSATTSFPSASTASLPTAPSYVPSRHEWSERWMNASINSKTLIAKDVAEAVVYLHSFSNPIIHRDLKSRNVLLDSHGNAKLSDFGISREMAEDETMTSEVGTSAWIAPEVLRGDRYSERADMYSFGVLLVEMDKCRHPYAGEDTRVLMDGNSARPAVATKQQQPRDTHSHAMHQNMQIAMLVSAGHLRPRPSVTCPARVQALIARCLSFAPEDRPSAMEAHYELRQILADG